MDIFKFQAYPLKENPTAVVVSVIISHLHIIDLRDPDKSRYLNFNNCFIIRSPVHYQIEITPSLPWVPEVFFSLEMTEFSGEAAKASREALLAQRLLVAGEREDL